MVFISMNSHFEIEWYVAVWMSTNRNPKLAL
jgi:hypothetical protein